MNGTDGSDTQGGAGTRARKVAKLSEIPSGGGLRVTVGGTDVGIFRVGDELFAIADACPHAGVPLSEGVLEGHTVVCMAHGWEFDVRTGLPCGAISGGMPIPRYRVFAEGDDVLLEL